MNMNAVGIDVSKWKITVAILRPGGKVVLQQPFRQVGGSLQGFSTW